MKLKMKWYKFSLLYFITLILSCKSENIGCDESKLSYRKINIGLKDNIYFNIDSMVFVKNNSKIVFYKTNTTFLDEKIRVCGNSCKYGGTCPDLFDFRTSYLNFQTIDKKHTITIANTFYYTFGTNYFDKYIYKIDSFYFTCKGNYEYYNSNEYVDSLFINNRIERKTIKMTSGFIYNDPNSFKHNLYVNENRKILRYINNLSNDTLDAE